MADIRIAEISVAEFPVPIIGDTPLLTNKYHSDDGDRIRDPQKEYMLCTHPIKTVELNGKELTIYGFPGSGLKKACVSVANTLVKGATKGRVRGSFFVVDYLMPIIGTDPIPFTIPAHTQRGTMIITTRAMFEKWRMNVRIRYLPTAIDQTTIIRLINWVGTSVGLGSYSPNCNGPYGTFHVITDSDLKDNPELKQQLIAEKVWEKDKKEKESLP